MHLLLVLIADWDQRISINIQIVRALSIVNPQKAHETYSASSLAHTPIHSIRPAASWAFRWRIFALPCLYTERITSPCGSPSTSAIMGMLHHVYHSDICSCWQAVDRRLPVLPFLGLSAPYTCSTHSNVNPFKLVFGLFAGSANHRIACKCSFLTSFEMT